MPLQPPPRAFHVVCYRSPITVPLELPPGLTLPPTVLASFFPVHAWVPAMWVLLRAEDRPFPCCSVETVYIPVGYGIDPEPVVRGMWSSPRQELLLPMDGPGGDERWSDLHVDLSRDPPLVSVYYERYAGRRGAGVPSAGTYYTSHPPTLEPSGSEPPPDATGGPSAGRTPPGA